MVIVSVQQAFFRIMVQNGAISCKDPFNSSVRGSGNKNRNSSPSLASQVLLHTTQQNNTYFPLYKPQQCDCKKHKVDRIILFSEIHHVLVLPEMLLLLLISSVLCRNRPPSIQLSQETTPLLYDKPFLYDKPE